MIDPHTIWAAAQLVPGLGDDMTELIDRLRFDAAKGYTICGEAADEIERLALDLHTERAAVVALRENGARLLAVADSAVQHQRGMVEAATEPLRAEVAALRAEVRELKTQAMFNRSTIERLTAKLEHAVEQAAKNADEVVRLRELVVEMREICKLGFRALDAAGIALLTIEPESSEEQEPMSDLLQQVHDVSMTLFTVARLPAQEAARAFYRKATP